MAAVSHRVPYSRPSPFAHSGFTASSARYVNVSDSDSDDEPPPAIKFSKATEALLNDRAIPPSPIRHGSAAHRAIKSAGALDTPSRAPSIRILRKSSPSTLGSVERQRGATPPRIVHIGSQQGSARRTISIAGPYPLAKRDATPLSGSRHEVYTPAFGRARSGSNTSQDGHVRPSSSRPGSRSGSRQAEEIKDLAASTSRAPALEPRVAVSTIGKTRNFSTDLPPPSQRIKRAPMTGTLLKSAPVRRTRRRESEDNVSPADEYNSAAPSQPSLASTPQDMGSRSRSNSVNTRATSIEPVSVHDFAQEKAHSRPSSRQAIVRPSSRQSNHEQIQDRLNSPDRYHPAPASLDVKASVERSHERRLPHRYPSVNHSYRYVSNADEQENAPPTFKRNKDQEFKYLGRINVTSDDEKPHRPVAVPVQADRRVLGAISSNTPLRPAPPPPPPKMSVLETATVTAGAATTKSRKKRSHVVINGKIFTQMGKIGKGGSSDVYCVMAENYKTFAMKKVKLDDCDENAVRGYKGEIDLLKKLTEVDRVIRLYDWELNEEKQELIVLMEKGDTDLNRVLTMKINGQDSKFDATFARYHWKEMLECVQAVHEHDIVHSDLKPANFLVVQGRLKLIDFGIANAIDIDNTCNVHRDSHVGTPNYMSPESITDTNASGPGFMSSKDSEGRPLKKDMRIGKSSDVWSLGCILYQMTYGRPPFAHIQNQISRIMAITNPKHIVEFPDTGIGGVRVPSSLKKTLRRCLQREPHLRPTIPEMLRDDDAFLNPDAAGVVITQQLLDQVINKIVDRCRDTKQPLPSASEVATYAPSFMARIREINEKT